MSDAAEKAEPAPEPSPDGEALITVKVPATITHTVAGRDIRLATMDELLNEISSRSVGCILAVQTVVRREGKHFLKIEGDFCTVQALCVLINADNFERQQERMKRKGWGQQER